MDQNILNLKCFIISNWYSENILKLQSLNFSILSFISNDVSSSFISNVDKAIEKFAQYLKEKENYSLCLDDFIVVMDNEFCNPQHVKDCIEDSISKCEHCACFPNVISTIDFKVEIDGKKFSFKYFDHDTESG